MLLLKAVFLVGAEAEKAQIDVDEVVHMWGMYVV